MAKSKKAKKKKVQADPNERLVCRNRKASFDYELFDDYEAGVQLQGSEVKSIRNNKVSLEEAYVRVKDGEAFLVGCDIAEYPQASMMNHEPRRPRKLLLHKRELAKLTQAVQQDGMTIIPLAVKFKGGRVKVDIAVARGKKVHDKRHKLKARDDSKAMREVKMKRM